MRVGIDARMVDWSGIGRYTRNLLRSLAELDGTNEYILFSNQANEHLIPELKANFILRRVDLPVFSLLTQRRWRKAITSEKLDLFFTPYALIPTATDCFSVGTVHDLIPWRMPEVQRSWGARVIYRPLIRRAVERLNFIITDSQFTQDDLIRFVKISERKIRVIPAAAEEIYRPVTDENLLESTKKKYRISRPYLLNVGTARPHKNLSFLIRVFARLGTSHQLVLAGADDVWRRGLRRLVDRLALNDRVVFTGFISDEELPALYSGAEVCLFPSLYEGFGLPALEAMACGRPVISSDGGALAEIVGEAGILINPTDEEAWLEAIGQVLTNKGLTESLRKKSLERAKMFSWRRTAQEILRVFYENCHRS